MAVWPFLMAGAATGLVAALIARDRDYAVAFGLMLLAYAAMRANVFAGWSVEVNLPAAVIWGLCAGAIRASTQLRVFPNLLGAIPACYLWAEVTAAPLAFGSAPYVLADLAAIAAMIGGGWGIGRFARSRHRGGLGRYHHRQPDCSGAGHVAVSENHRPDFVSARIQTRN